MRMLQQLITDNKIKCKDEARVRKLKGEEGSKQHEFKVGGELKRETGSRRRV